MRGASCKDTWLHYCERLLPEVMADAGCRALLRVMLYSHRRDKLIDEAAVLLPYGTLARCEDAADLVATRGYRGSVALMLRFKDRVEMRGFRFTWNRPDKRMGQCRAGLLTGPKEFFEMAAKEQAGELPGRRVVWMDGSVWTRRKANTFSKVEKVAAAQQIIKVAPTGLTKDLCEYHNTQSSNAFVAMVPMAEAMIGEAAALENPNKRRQALVSLQAIVDCPQPIYQAAPRTARAIQVGMGLGTLPKVFRRKLIKAMGWVVLDGVNIQLACFATMAGCEQILSFLRGGGDWWKEMATHCRATLKTAKGPAKRATYALCFGSGKAKARMGVAEELVKGGMVEAQADRTAKRLMRHPLFMELKRKRAEMLKRIREAGHAVSCLGERIEVTKDRPAHKVLAALAQSMEQALMWSLYEVAIASKGEMIIRQNIYDGVAIQFVTRGEYWLARAMAAYRAKAVAMGVPSDIKEEE